MRVFLFFLVCVATCQMHPQAGVTADPHQHAYRPQRGFVPDQTTAVAIAQAVWLPIYGKETLDKERPFKAILKRDVWTVTGTAHWVNKNDKGGTAVAEISRIDGRIIRVSHGM